MKARFDRQTCVVETPGRYSIQFEDIFRSHRPAAKSVLFVNGALASSRSFRWALGGLPDHNLILYDLPHMGSSKQYNTGASVITLEAEVAILRCLIDRYAPSYIASMSWGGVAALLSLAECPVSVEKAIVASFSNRVTEEMRVLLEELDRLIALRRDADCAHLINDTFGKHLPAGFKRANYSHLATLGDGERDYITLHIKRMLQFDQSHFSSEIKNTSAEILFINGGNDVYTPWPDVGVFAQSFARSQTAVIAQAGHFLTAESAANARKVARIANSFFETTPLCGASNVILTAEATVPAP